MRRASRGLQVRRARRRSARLAKKGGTRLALGSLFSSKKSPVSCLWKKREPLPRTTTDPRRFWACASTEDEGVKLVDVRGRRPDSDDREFKRTRARVALQHTLSNESKALTLREPRSKQVVPGFAPAVRRFVLGASRTVHETVLSLSLLWQRTKARLAKKRATRETTNDDENDDSRRSPEPDLRVVSARALRRGARRHRGRGQGHGREAAGTKPRRAGSLRKECRARAANRERERDDDDDDDDARVLARCTSSSRSQRRGGFASARGVGRPPESSFREIAGRLSARARAEGLRARALRVATPRPTTVMDLYQFRFGNFDTVVLRHCRVL